MRQSFRVIRGKRAAESGQESQSSRELPTFEEALLTHFDAMFAFALRLTGGQRSRAEDLLQEACLRAFRNYKSLRSPESIKRWFFKILVNANINQFHKLSREPSIVDVELAEEILDSATLDQARTPEEHMLQHLLDDEIQEALDSLPIKFSTVVWLSDVEELSYKEIAEIVNCPLGTIASRLYRGHNLLRERLKQYARRRGLMKE